MGKYSLEGLEKNKNFSIKGVIVPKSGQFYFSNIKFKKISNKIKILKSDNKDQIFNFIKKLKPDVVIISTFNKIFEKKNFKIIKIY